MKPSTIITVIFLSPVCVAYLLRPIFQAKIMLNVSEISMWMSLAAFIFRGALETWLRIDNRKVLRIAAHRAFAGFL